MKKSEIDVHRRHCCIRHGCKYGDDGCPVAKGEIKQYGPCWYCYEEEGYKPKPDPDKSVKLPDIEWVSPPEPSPKIIISENVKINKEFLKGFIWAFLIIIMMHIGLAYAIFI